MKNFKSGVKLSPKDDRDFKISKLIVKSRKLPTKFCREIPFIKNQDDINSCVAHSLDICKRSIEFEQMGKQKNFSTKYIYGNRSDSMYQDEGMIPREALKTLKNFGICENYLFPGNSDYPTSKSEYLANKIKLDENAINYRISAFARLYTVDDIKEALYNIGPVTICIDIRESFDYVDSTGILKIPNVDEYSRGYHQVTLFGYDDETQLFIGANSWGIFWGDKGKFYMPYNYPIEEMWSITDNIYPSIDDMKTKIEFQIGKLYYTIDDNTNMNMDVAPFLKNNRTMVPIRFISNSLGCHVEWNNGIVTVNKENLEIKVQQDNKIAYVNNKEVMLDVEPVNLNDRIFVPIRFIAENLGCKVEWIDNEKKVILNK